VTRPLPRVAVLGCGGTISTRPAHPLDWVDYPETGAKLSAEEVLAAMPEAAASADCLALPFRSVGSNAIGPEDWQAMAEAIAAVRMREPDLAGVVILHGTATLEETAYYLHLTLASDLPVVMTAAQRPPGTLASDAPANLHAALRVAADPGARGRGVLVVLNGQIHCAREATKGTTLRPDAFHSGGAGPLGVADPDRVVFARSPERPHGAATPFAPGPLPRVDVLYAVAGGDGALAHAALAAGARVIAATAFAPGMPPPAERDALDNGVRAGVAVVQASRVGTGRVIRRAWLREHGWIAGDDLTPQKARILLMLGLTRAADPETLQGFFDTY